MALDYDRSVTDTAGQVALMLASKWPLADIGNLLLRHVAVIQRSKKRTFKVDVSYSNF